MSNQTAICLLVPAAQPGELIKLLGCINWNGDFTVVFHRWILRCHPQPSWWKRGLIHFDPIDSRWSGDKQLTIDSINENWIISDEPLFRWPRWIRKIRLAIPGEDPAIRKRL